MLRSLCVISLLAFGLACDASAATVELPDSTLAMFVKSGSDTGTLDAITDIAGDPGTQFDFTFEDNGTAWTQAPFSLMSPTDIGLGDTWSITVKNTDAYQLALKIWVKVDSSWTYSETSGGWLGVGETKTVEMLNPATTEIRQLGITVGTQGWTNRPAGSSASMQILSVVPEPSSLVMFALGGLLLLRKRS